MTDTKEETKVNENATHDEAKQAKAKKTHSKVDLKNMFKSKHNSKNMKKDTEAKDNNQEAKPEAKPEEKKDEPKAEGGENNNDEPCNLEGDAKKPLDDCEGCKDEVLHETDKAAGKPIVGFSEKVGASFRKWFHLAGAPQ